MTMTKQHFEMIAETVRQTSFREPAERELLAIAFANKLRATNPNFNRERFLRACGVED